MIPTHGQTIEFALYKLIDNSSYKYEETPSVRFQGKVANNIEKKQYRILQGVHGTSESVYILTSNLPEEVSDGDQIEYLGKKSTILSTGYYLDESRIVNFKIMNNKYIISKCPKGIVIG